MASANLFLNGSRVTPGFRDAVFAAANRAGVSPSEFVLLSAAEKLMRRGIPFDGVFVRGDCDFLRDPPAGPCKALNEEVA